jgi:general stress protein 26
MTANSKENLSGTEAIKKIKELVEHGRSCFMMTALDKLPMSIRPMGPQKVTENGDLLFFSDRNSRKNSELQLSKKMHLSFQNDGDNEYLSLSGTAEVYRDQSEINELYNSFANIWFEGKDDPNLTIIRFTPQEGHYWDSKHGKILQMLSFVFGAITGKQTDNGLQGDLKPH